MTTEKIAQFITSISFNTIPADVVEKAKMCVLDVLGSSFAALDTLSVHAVYNVTQVIEGKKEASVVGFGNKASVFQAAWINSMLANALDIDDGNFWSKGHAGHHGAMVVPAALSVAESQGLSGKKLLEAVVVGYEVGIHAGYIMSAHGVNFGGPMGCYGAVASSVKLLGLTNDEIVHALGIVDAHNPIGGISILKQMPSSNRPRAMTKEKIGWGTFCGVFASYLAKEGMTGPVSIFDDLTSEYLSISKPNTQYEIMKVYHKLYSSCRLTHCALDAVFYLTQKYHIEPSNIERVIVAGSSVASKINSYPVQNIEDMQFSIQFLIGAALVDGAVGSKQVNVSRLHDPMILEQAQKVVLTVDPEIEALGVAGELGAVVTIEKKDGVTYKKRITHAKGDVENPLSYDELRDKFRLLAEKPLGNEKTEEVIKYIDDLENVNNIEELMTLVGFCKAD